MEHKEQPMQGTDGAQELMVHKERWSTGTDGSQQEQVHKEQEEKQGTEDTRTRGSDHKEQVEQVHKEQQEPGSDGAQGASGTGTGTMMEHKEQWNRFTRNNSDGGQVNIHNTGTRY